MERVRKKALYTAEQWTKGKTVAGVVDAGPFIQTGHFTDRFNDRPDVYCVVENERKAPVNENDWIVTDGDGKQSVYSNEQFKLIFEKA